MPRDALEALNLGDMERPPMKKFFQTCLDKSEEFKARNEKYCKGTARYTEPARVNVGRAMKRAFKWKHLTFQTIIWNDNCHQIETMIFFDRFVIL